MGSLAARIGSISAPFILGLQQTIKWLPSSLFSFLGKLCMYFEVFNKIHVYVCNKFVLFQKTRLKDSLCMFTNSSLFELALISKMQNFNQTTEYC